MTASLSISREWVLRLVNLIDRCGGISFEKNRAFESARSRMRKAYKLSQPHSVGARNAIARLGRGNGGQQMNFGIQRAKDLPGFSQACPLSNEGEDSGGGQAYRQLRTTVHALMIFVAGLALCRLIYFRQLFFIAIRPADDLSEKICAVPPRSSI
jgi:hypothetical protein